MSLLSTKKNFHGQNRRWANTFVIGIGVIATSLVSLQVLVPGALARVTHTLAQPAWSAGAGVGETWTALTTGFQQKQHLQGRIEELETRVQTLETQLASYPGLRANYERLQSMLGRSPRQATTTLARVLAGPGESPYDTLVLDAGAADGIAVDDPVRARGGVVLGEIADVRPHSATAALYSAPGTETRVRFAATGTPVTLIGQGGGSYTTQMPRGVDLQAGAAASLPRSPLAVIATVATIEAGEQDALQQVYLSVPFNVFELQWVLVEIDK